MAGGSTKVVLAAMVANGGIAVAKFIGWSVTGSASMLAEAVHSCADTGNQALLLFGSKRAQRTATIDHPFGYGRERYFWGFVVAIVLFSLGSLYAIYEGIEKIRHPHEIESLWWAIGILGFSILLEAYAFRQAVLESKKVKRPGVTWPQFIRRSRIPELPVVLLEDAGAMFGLILASGAILTAKFTGNAVWDGVGTLCIGILLGVISIVLAIEMKSLLIGEGALPEQNDRITAAISGAPHVDKLIHMRTQYMGPDEMLVAAKVQFSSGLSVADLADAVDTTEKAIRAAEPVVRIIYLEPDLFEANHTGITEMEPEDDHH